MILRRVLVGCTVVCAIGALAREALAFTSCAVASASGPAFGRYDVFSPWPTDAVGTLSIQCTGGAGAAVVWLGRGAAPGYFPRHMRSGAAALDYNLYVDSARTAVWGDGTGGSNAYGPFSPPEGETQILNVFGRVFPGQTSARVGDYADTVVVTIVF